MKDTLLLSLEHLVTQQELIAPGSTVIVGLSGGPDSVFLLHFLAQLRVPLNLTIIAAHLDHQWRTNSANDVVFCKNLAEGYGIAFEHGQASDLPHDLIAKGSAEATGRNQRRYFLQQLAHKHGAHVIALGHHAQDQQETFFIRLIRGTTLSGLCGMQLHDGLFVRPLLLTNKRDIIAYLDEQNIAYLVDPTNESHDFLRNRIRATVLPALQACDNRFDEQFLRTITSLQESEDILQNITERAFADATKEHDGHYQLNITSLAIFPPAIIKRIIIHWLIAEQVEFTLTESFLAEVIRFLAQEHGGEHRLHPTWGIAKKQNIASIVRY